MKKLGVALATIVATFAATPSFGATATNTFNVNINLTSACLVNTTATNVAFTYTSFQTGNSLANSSFTMQCTNGLAITSVGLDGAPNAGVYSYTNATTGLTYTLSLGATPASNGLANTVIVNGIMASGQAGTCGTAACNGIVDGPRTITVTF